MQESDSAISGLHFTCLKTNALSISFWTRYYNTKRIISHKDCLAMRDPLGWELDPLYPVFCLYAQGTVGFVASSDGDFSCWRTPGIWR